MLTVVTGPMFAGKTSYLINYTIASSKVGRSYGLFKPLRDNRYGDSLISSHNGITLPATPVNSPIEILECIKDFEDFGTKADLVGIDETQFFDATHTQKVIEELLHMNYQVLCVGLAQNSFGEPFGAMGALMAMADEVIQLPAICAACKKNKATRTFRKSASTERVLVGGSDDYEPRCFNCWRQ